ncbi:hypothetical protein BHYA_0009g00400 [Botrytis hyacinthi]|uniref:Uncharacterized protein n=1 Tax=Botrytis hyacinthi TaxID=278943 RepID=A0A4Z1H3H3_9HELO|nr:hypothetical protein BHYA_0009g00400 [Botrytis hyacinthi]
MVKPDEISIHTNTALPLSLSLWDQILPLKSHYSPPPPPPPPPPSLKQDLVPTLQTFRGSSDPDVVFHVESPFHIRNPTFVESHFPNEILCPMSTRRGPQFLKLSDMLFLPNNSQCNGIPEEV